MNKRKLKAIGMLGFVIFALFLYSMFLVYGSYEHKDVIVFFNFTMGDIDLLQTIFACIYIIFNFIDLAFDTFFDKFEKNITKRFLEASIHLFIIMIIIETISLIKVYIFS